MSAADSPSAHPLTQPLAPETTPAPNKAPFVAGDEPPPLVKRGHRRTDSVTSAGNSDDDDDDDGDDGMAAGNNMVPAADGIHLVNTFSPAEPTPNQVRQPQEKEHGAPVKRHFPLQRSATIGGRQLPLGGDVTPKMTAEQLGRTMKRAKLERRVWHLEQQIGTLRAQDAEDPFHLNGGGAFAAGGGGGGGAFAAGGGGAAYRATRQLLMGDEPNPNGVAKTEDEKRRMAEDAKNRTRLDVLQKRSRAIENEMQELKAKITRNGGGGAFAAAGPTKPKDDSIHDFLAHHRDELRASPLNSQRIARITDARAELMRAPIKNRRPPREGLMSPLNVPATSSDGDEVATNLFGNGDTDAFAATQEQEEDDGGAVGAPRTPSPEY